MSKLLEYRKKLNYTQDELSDKSGVSVRTIQRIEAGAELKGHTLKVIAQALNVNPSELKDATAVEPSYNYPLIKVINLASLVFFIPLANIVVPLVIMHAKKEKNEITKQIVSIQILWILAIVIVFFMVQTLQNAFSLHKQLTLSVLLGCILINIIIVLRNAFEIDKNKQLRIKLNYSIV
ncbi:helix-turn-helix domain-containing protein [Aquimarina brevivitae]|uniref:Transcriptional regulator with XRE-family HTH domain n=1 Tax=Aquimarina brevivitae TaxID=323412 RepID=A0A4Q7P351_9FLAO|nr:helix-turn-helix domain-containing protein [Aquimarina brevivitae]RZS93820.1 transcriptional regulator with XRE-family HTH domain [Aquimarina brevivitae]